MARRSLARQVFREIEKSNRAAERDRKARERAHAKALRDTERELARVTKEEKRLYAEARAAEAERQTDGVQAEIESLGQILRATLSVDDWVDLNDLKVDAILPDFDPGALATEEPPPEASSFVPEALGGIGRLVPGAKARRLREIDEGRERFE